MSVDDTEFRYLATFDTILFTKGGFGIKSAQKSFSFFFLPGIPLRELQRFPAPIDLSILPIPLPLSAFAVSTEINR